MPTTSVFAGFPISANVDDKFTLHYIQKMPECEIFDLLDSCDFYTVRPQGEDFRTVIKKIKNATYAGKNSLRLLWNPCVFFWLLLNNSLNLQNIFFIFPVPDLPVQIGFINVNKISKISPLKNLDLWSLLLLGYGK